MTWRATLDYLFSQLPMFQRVGPAAFKKDLTNTRALCEALGNPHERFPSIHIAGTNGKGSTAHILAAVLQKRGFKVGLYTSPHYRDFRERIKINGKFISRRDVMDFVQKNRTLFETIQPSFFEITVALAFDYFARKKVDIAIIETGLGGRLDSTNIITPLLSVITNISRDHTQFLGNTFAEIAGEKAGIIKPGIPVVVGEYLPETKPVFIQKAQEMNAPLFFASERWRVEKTGEAPPFTFFDAYLGNRLQLPGLKARLMGKYQTKNLATALQTLQILDRHYPVFGPFVETLLREALLEIKPLTRFIGRWEVIGQNPAILCDSAHNYAGLSEVFAEIQCHHFDQLHIVCGFVADKSVEEVLPLFPQNARYYFAKADIPRGMEARQLKSIAAKFGLQGRTYISVKNALLAAKRNARPNDLIFVGGSIFVVAEVI
ncbi:MAG: bifunctional folylpolyglutamate synthase/dihydrofolate synthase [Bacteroidetes bacterium]|nr:MAG: bifunctional folylpolyglutamate synthase/dihydrofolate synthase [Bacteroidota bacterium]